MLNTCRTLLVIALSVISSIVTSQADSITGRSWLGEPAATMLADSGNPWALPAPPSDPYSQPVQPYQRGPHFITPEELNSIYKQPDKGEQANRGDALPRRTPGAVYNSPGTGFDPMLPGAIYPGIEGGIYSPYGLSPYYTPNNFNSVAPFIY
jgi:hypothetical protein